MAFDVSVITIKGSSMLAAATTANKLVMTGCDATQTPLGESEAMAVQNRPTNPYSTTTDVSLVGSTDNHVFIRAAFNAGESTGGDVNTLYLYGHTADDPTHDYVLAVMSSQRPFHLPSVGDVSGSFGTLFDIIYSVTADSITAATTSVYTTLAEFNAMKARTVTTHSADDDTVGDNQGIRGDKWFYDDVSFYKDVNVQGDFECEGERADLPSIYAPDATLSNLIIESQTGTVKDTMTVSASNVSFEKTDTQQASWNFLSGASIGQYMISSPHQHGIAMTMKTEEHPTLTPTIASYLWYGGESGVGGYTEMNVGGDSRIYVSKGESDSDFIDEARIENKFVSVESESCTVGFSTREGIFYNTNNGSSYVHWSMNLSGTGNTIRTYSLSASASESSGSSVTTVKKNLGRIGHEWDECYTMNLSTNIIGPIFANSAVQFETDIVPTTNNSLFIGSGTSGSEKFWKGIYVESVFCGYLTATNNGNVELGGNIIPDVDVTQYGDGKQLGDSSRRFASVYAQSLNGCIPHEIEQVQGLYYPKVGSIFLAIIQPAGSSSTTDLAPFNDVDFTKFKLYTGFFLIGKIQGSEIAKVDDPGSFTTGVDLMHSGFKYCVLSGVPAMISGDWALVLVMRTA